MRFLILIPVYLYWHLWPAKWKHRQCLFRESCSHHVWRVTREEGFLPGWRALVYRYRNCRPGYRIQLTRDGTFEMVLVHGDIIGESDIAIGILHPYEKVRDFQSHLASKDPAIMGYITKETNAIGIRAGKHWR